MADNLDISGPEDKWKINVNQNWEIEDWSKKLGVTTKELKDAVDEVGPWVKDVKKHLGLD